MELDAMRGSCPEEKPSLGDLAGQDLPPTFLRPTPMARGERLVTDGPFTETHEVLGG